MSNTQTLKKYIVVDGDRYLDGNGYWQPTLSLAHRYPSLTCATADVRRNKTKRPNVRMVPVDVTERILDDQKVHIP